ncbi:MAG: trigger factor [candidate division KSB1 bacterium]|nr:trigger factor [candidate division KSB1 bacterium]MDZ7335636.1 trigger factor [candidate division KSB1 bacterium]MDZ7358080.1 trigger factor [candidate division KSB1 bacterium]MDZ7399840.1 trigger factor [candidate division KSB1 bacterium]
MEVHIEEQGQWERAVEVTVPYEKLLPKFDEAYAKYKKTIQWEGFRKGKVPLDLIKKALGPKIEREVAEDSIPGFLEEAVKENNLKLYDISQLESISYDRTNGLHFKAIIKIRPEVTLKKYKALEIEKEIYQITDDDLNDFIENLREQHASMSTFDGEAQRGHYIVADVQGVDVAGLPLIGKKYENRYFYLDDGETDPEFVNQLIGVKAGETRRVTLTVQNRDPNKPDNQVEYYDISVKEIKQKELPTLDDEFAKDIGPYETLNDLREAIRKNLEQRAQDRTQQNLTNRIMDEVIKSNPIELPDYMVENFLDAFIKDMNNSQQQTIDSQEVREKYRADAIWNLKWLLILEKIAELENIKVQESEINDYIETMAQLAGKNAVAIRNKYRDPKKREQVEHKLLEKKVIDLLRDNAIITDKIVTYQDVQRAQDLIIR